MKAMVIDQYGGADQLHFREVETPPLIESEVMIDVAYAGVNPVDWKICKGLLDERLPHEFPIILGWDVAGTVVKKGAESIVDLQLGDQVFAYVRKPIIKWGSYAEYVTYDAVHVEKIPQTLSLIEASTVPLVSLTAWQALFDAAQLKNGETILIHGASGAVGSMAVQFAKDVGAKVLAAASRKRFEYLKRLKADVLIDRHGNLEEQVKEKVDVVFDTVGGDLFRKSLKFLKPEGRIVSILEKMSEHDANQQGIQAFYVFVSPNGEQLKTIGELIDQGRVILPPITEMPLQDAAKALELQKSGTLFGKISLKID